MANADFSQNNKQTAPGGFDAGSYREKAKPEQTVKLTPRQQKLAALEAKLPAALSTRAAAVAVGGNENKKRKAVALICTPNTGHPVWGYFYAIQL